MWRGAGVKGSCLFENFPFIRCKLNHNREAIGNVLHSLIRRDTTIEDSVIKDDCVKSNKTEEYIASLIIIMQQALMIRSSCLH